MSRRLVFGTTKRVLQSIHLWTLLVPLYMFGSSTVTAGRRRRRAKAYSKIAAASTREQLQRFFDSFRVVDPGLPLIRIGAERDGGYLIPDDLGGVAACFSPGVSAVADFELQLTALGIPCFLTDASVDGPPVENRLIDFEKKHLGTDTRDGWTTLVDWVSAKAPEEGDLLLQMDIEDGEWPVLEDADPGLLRRFRIIVVELHNLHMMCSDSRLGVVSAVFEKLLGDFELVHLHPNNNSLPVPYLGFELQPDIEATFLRKDRVRSVSPVAGLPHPSDRANHWAMPDVRLAPFWYLGRPLEGSGIKPNLPK
jgi:hypothetical protein